MRPWGIEETGGRPLGEELTSGVVTPGRYDEAREKSLGKDMAGEPGRTDGGYGEGMEVALCRKSYLGLPAIEEAGGRPPGTMRRGRSPLEKIWVGSPAELMAAMVRGWKWPSAANRILGSLP